MKNELAPYASAYRRRSDVVRAFRLVADLWGLSSSEAAALAGMAMSLGGRAELRRCSSFVLERMALAVEIDAILRSLMEGSAIPGWLRRWAPGLTADCPLGDMFGSSDRLRRIRAMLMAEGFQS